MNSCNIDLVGYTGDEKREYQLNWMKARRSEWIQSQGGKCALCGSTEELEVDHIDPKTKSMNPAQVWSRKQSVRDEELAKCQVLCGPHHLEKSIRESQAPHGSASAYNRGCRCRDCTDAAVARVYAWRAAKNTA